jgi:hypothetical protein
MLVFDSFIFGAAVYEAHGLDAVPYGLGHEVAIQLPLIHQLVVPLGAVRACHENAHRLFERGCKVVVYPGGDLDADAALPRSRSDRLRRTPRLHAARAARRGAHRAGDRGRVSRDLRHP